MKTQAFPGFFRLMSLSVGFRVHPIPWVSGVCCRWTGCIHRPSRLARCMHPICLLLQDDSRNAKLPQCQELFVASVVVNRCLGATGAWHLSVAAPVGRTCRSRTCRSFLESIVFGVVLWMQCTSLFGIALARSQCEPGRETIWFWSATRRTMTSTMSGCSIKPTYLMLRWSGHAGKRCLE